MERTASDSDREHRSRDQRDAERDAEGSTAGRGSIATLHRSVGNQAVKELHEQDDLQAKLAVSQPSDRSERESDRVADAVLSMSDPERSEAETAEIQRESGSGGTNVDGETERQSGRSGAAGRHSRIRRARFSKVGSARTSRTCASIPDRRPTRPPGR
jgi:hypothetical protein